MQLKTLLKFIPIIWVMLITACGTLSGENLQATVNAAVKATTEAQQNIQSTIEAAVKSTAQSQNPSASAQSILVDSLTLTNTEDGQVTKTPTLTQTPTLELLSCKQQKYQETCYNQPSILQGRFFITVWVKDFDKNSIPYIEIDNTPLSCKAATSEPNKNSISCSSLIFHNGVQEIKLFSYENELLYSGKINIAISLPPTPTSTRKPKGQKENTTSVPPTIYPNP